MNHLPEPGGLRKYETLNAAQATQPRPTVTEVANQLLEQTNMAVDGAGVILGHLGVPGAPETAEGPKPLGAGLVGVLEAVRDRQTELLARLNRIGSVIGVRT